MYGLVSIYTCLYMFNQRFRLLVLFYVNIEYSIRKLAIQYIPITINSEIFEYVV